MGISRPKIRDLPRYRVDERQRNFQPITLCAMIVDQDGLAVVGQNIALGHDCAQPINEGIQIGWRNPMETCKHQPIEFGERERFGIFLRIQLYWPSSLASSC